MIIHIDPGKIKINKDVSSDDLTSEFLSKSIWIFKVRARHGSFRRRRAQNSIKFYFLSNSVGTLYSFWSNSTVSTLSRRLVSC